MATFPGKPPNPLGVKVELNLNGTWTDITAYVMLRDTVQITNMGRTDESGSISPAQMTLTLNNRDGRFTPKNASGAYFPNIVRNCQVRVSVNATSVTGVNYNNFRFFGEIASWPPGYNISQDDVYVSITASGIWRRLSQSGVPIGSCFWRYLQLLTGTSVPAAYWAMEDGSAGTGLNGFVLSGGTGTNMTVTSAPSYSSDGASFLGSNALPTLNGARCGANVTMAATPTSFAVWFALSVPASGDSGTSTFAAGGQLVKILTGGTVATITVTLTQGNQLAVSGQNSGGTTLFTGTITTKVNGTPVLCSYEQTTGAYALKIIKPGAGSLLDQVTASGFSWTTGKVTQVQVNPEGKAQDTTAGQVAVFGISSVSVITAAPYIGGLAGETATTRMNRICAESNIPITIVGSGGAAQGPQVSDTIANVLQSIEDTDGGLLYETTGQFGLGYRTLASMQNQAAALTIAHTSGALGDTLSPTYDDQLIKNQWTVTGYDGYSVTAQLNSGAMSLSAPPNGVGQGYAASKTINANTHAQVNAIAQQLLLQGTVDDVRYPTVTVTFRRTLAAPFFSSVPSMKLGDFFQISSLPAFLGGGTTKQLMWGYSETLGGDPPDWTLILNTIPELPFETSFSPGSFTVLQGSAGGVPQGSSVGSTVSGSQIGPGAVGAGQTGVVLTARSIGGMTQFIAAATPYKWTFAVTGTPADTSYFICAPDQALPIAPGDTFSNTAGLGSPFTVTQVDPAAAGQVTVHYTPNSVSVMSSGTVRGGTNGDTWVNTSAGNVLNSWGAGVWNVITWNAANVIQAGTVTTNEILANTITAGDIAAGTIVSGIVDTTNVFANTYVATNAAGEFLAYDTSSPTSGHLVNSIAGATGTDSAGNPYPEGLFGQQLTLQNQPGGGPPSFAGSSVFYSSVLGRPRYVSAVGDDSALERSQVSQTNVSMTTQTAATAISGTLTVQVGEANVGSEFEIEILGIITAPTGGSGWVSGNGTIPYTMQMMVDGSLAGGAFTLGGVYLVGGGTFNFNAGWRLSIEATGAGGTSTMTGWGTFLQQGVNIGNINAGGFGVAQSAASVGSGKAFDTTASHTLKIFGFWGSTLMTGHHVTTYRTKTGRRM